MSDAAMMRYEALILTVPEITSDESSMIESQVHSLISAARGEVLSFERWGKYRLAYHVRNYEYGVYFLMRFEIPSGILQATLEEVRRLLGVKYRDIVMRFVIVKLDKSSSLAYKRPESLEDVPRREAGEAGERGMSRGRDTDGVDDVVNALDHEGEFAEHEEESHDE
jgi:ribosomal protein S6